MNTPRNAHGRNVQGGPRLLLVGGGRMGGALIRGWLDRGLTSPDRLVVVEPGPDAAQAMAALGITVVPSPDRIGDGVSPGPAPDLVILAVKPQIMDQVVPGYRPLAESGAPFLSIAAGRSLASLAALLGDTVPLIRAMPNTPAQIGRGITALCANPHVPAALRDLAGALMAAVGQVVWLETESQMDAVTAVSGSGPAYLFAMIESLSAAGEKAGLPPEMAETLARATLCGAAELAWSSSRPAGELRAEVTSPGGTTAAALEILLGREGLEPLMARAVAAAAQRSRELAG